MDINQNSANQRWRRHRVAAALGLQLPAATLADPRPWHAVVCSHLGRSLRTHHRALATLFHWTQDSLAGGAAQLCVAGTAAAPWVQRACDLLHAAPLKLALADDAAAPQAADCLLVCSPHRPGNRDQLAILLADSVDVVWLRRGGAIERYLRQRLSQPQPGIVRLLLPSRPSSTTVRFHRWMAAGAVGGFVSWPTAVARSVAVDRSGGPRASAPLPAVPREVPRDASQNQAQARAQLAAWQLAHQPADWLIHCTRTAAGRWPGQSAEQFADSLLLTPPQEFDGTPMAALQRIVAQQRLIGSGLTSRRRQPVVCLSDRPLLEIIGRRQYRCHLGRWDAEPYGIAVRKAVAAAQGARPVCYLRDGRRIELADGHPVESADGDASGSRALPGDATVAADWLCQPAGRRGQWLAEREWRLPAALNLQQCQADQVVVFVPSAQQAAALSGCRWPVVDRDSVAAQAAMPGPATTAQ